MKNARLSKFKYTAAPLVLGLAMLSTPAFAQAAEEEEAESDATIVVTGSIFSRTDKATPSPVTTVTEEDLDKRGISTIQDAIQSLSANNGPALTNSFSANGAFAAGASAVSLRGLSVNSTLVLFDGMRAAYYPLADDGTRNFVDLNTIPDDIVDRIEVLRDGASSSYGADAIAGVVNIITKREVQGISGRVEAGIAEGGFGATQRFSLTAGYGDLEEKGFNVYASGFYVHSAEVENSKLAYPFNTDDQTGICFEGTCGPNNVVNGISSTGGFALSTAGNYIVRPYADATITTPALGRWQNLSTDCQSGTLISLTAAQQGAAFPTQVCQYDFTKLYGTVAPQIDRFGFSTRATVMLGDTTEAYIQANFLQSTVSYDGFPNAVSANGPLGIFGRRFSTSTNPNPTNDPGSRILSLPVFVCPRGTTVACTAANGVLNPNNPFAAAGQVARIIGRDHSRLQFNETRNRAYRAALGIRGDISENISYDIGATAMHVDLRRKQDGYIQIQRLLDVVADGSYNFINPSANTQAVIDYLTPVNITNASSDQLQFQAILSANVTELPGGPLQIGGGVTIRHEAVDAPSANSDDNGPTQRYFVLNAFGTSGSREIYSAFGEIEAPVFDMLTLNASGRYDEYSSGQSAFSPKAGFKFTPISQIALRGTWSKGFRIPSFAEANAFPTTGFVTNNASLFNNTFLAPYGCTTATFATCPVYIRNGSYGQTTLASPNLKPEKSRSITLGVLVEPTRNISFSVDYYNIKKTGVITQPSNAPAILAFYTGQPIPAGYTVIADAPDVNFPLAPPRIAFVQSQLINATTYQVSGLDFGANIDLDITDDISLSSTFDASYILKLEADLTAAGGGLERYDGTLGNFNLTAGSGTPKLNGSWLNSLRFNQFELNLTTNYRGGYDLSAQDQGTGYKDCGLSSGYTPCKVKAHITMDLGVRVKINDKFTVYGTVLNLFDNLPPIDHVTYGAHLYNPVQAGNSVYGRQFRAGVRFGL